MVVAASSTHDATMSDSDHKWGGGWAAANGVSLISATKEQVILELTISDVHRQPWGLVHGGVHCGLVEAACSIGAQLNAPAGVNIVGAENHTSFLRPVKDGVLRATSKPLHLGRKAQLWQTEIHDDRGRLVASGRLRTFAVEKEQ